MTLPTLCLFDLEGVVADFLPERRLPELADLLGNANTKTHAGTVRIDYISRT